MSTLLQPNHAGIFRCPLCPWHLAVPPVSSRQETLGNVFGPGVMLAIDNTRRLQQVERDLHDHLSQHSLVDWIQKIRALEQSVLDRLLGMNESDRIRVWHQLDAGGVICMSCGRTKDQGVCWACFKAG